MMEVLLAKILLDVISIVMVMIFCFLFAHFMPVYNRVYFCSDSSLNYPYDENNGSELFALFPYIFIFSVSLGVMTAFEAVTYPWKLIRNKGFRPLLGVLYNNMTVFMFGFFASLSISLFLKSYLGIMRPNFTSACEPKLDCDIRGSHHLIFTSFNCTVTDKARIENAKWSFPSIFAVVSVYSTAFLCFYFESKSTNSFLALLKRVFEIALIGFTAVGCLMPIQEYTQHWSDVAGGIVIGFLTAFPMNGTRVITERRLFPIKKVTFHI